MGNVHFAVVPPGQREGDSVASRKHTRDIGLHHLWRGGGAARGRDRHPRGSSAIPPAGGCRARGRDRHPRGSSAIPPAGGCGAHGWDRHPTRVLRHPSGSLPTCPSGPTLLTGMKPRESRVMPLCLRKPVAGTAPGGTGPLCPRLHSPSPLRGPPETLVSPIGPQVPPPRRSP